MAKSPRLSNKSSRTTQEGSSQPQSSLTAPLLIFMTALDTTWRAFVPTLGGVFLGIGIDNLANSAPVGTIICLVLGVSLSIFLIVKQLRDIRRTIR